MANILIHCITLSGGTGHEHITHVGTSKGKLSVRQVVDQILMGDEFFVADSETGKWIRVETMLRPDVKHTFIQTVADGRPTNNLLSLPHC
jgi:hypothetical protein